MSEENFFPGENGEVGEESTPKVSLEKPRQEVRQGIYQEGGMQRQGEYRESADAAGGVYEQSPYQQPYPYTEPAPSQGFGVASLVLGIVSLVLFCTCVNVLLAVIAIVFGIVQLAKPQAKKGMAIAGIITSAVSLFRRVSREDCETDWEKIFITTIPFRMMIGMTITIPFKTVLDK